MAELLLELLSEEMPARVQGRAAAELRRLVGERLAAAGLDFAAAAAYATPRRLALHVTGLPLRQPDTAEERKGPRVGSPERAVEGFLKANGLADLAEAEQRDTGKGVFYFAVLRREGQPTAAVLPPLLAEALQALPWPRSMRWNGHRLRWVRPLHRLLCLFDGALLPLEFGHLTAGDRTAGHRFMGGGDIAVGDFAGYRDQLQANFVVLDAAERRRLILAAAERLAAAAGLRLVEDAGLLDEVTGLVEWPVVLSGGFDADFLALPREVLSTAMRAHQKYFSLEDAEGKLAPRFLTVANLAADDGGGAIVAGNERVLRARLADARFFWDQDRKARLDSRVPALRDIVFYEGLGTMADKAVRLQALAGTLAGYVAGADPDSCGRAALLAKADLTTGMVGEFPELQGVMGRYYALHDGEPAAVAAAVAEHYAPLGPADRCPTAPVSIVAALADKLDTLTGFFGLGEKPTGSKDPFALRRAALGVIRLILENRLRLPLLALLTRGIELHPVPRTVERRSNWPAAAPAAVWELLDFFADRLKVHLRESGVRHDLIAAVFALGGEDDLVRLLDRVEALRALLDSADGANLLVAYRRAANILRIEEKKDGRRYDAPPDEALLVEAEERALHAELERQGAAAAAALAAERFVETCQALARLRPAVDAFFDRVTVNAEAAELRANRLCLLARIRTALDQVADFSQIEG